MMKERLDNYKYICTLCHKEHGKCSCDNVGSFERCRKDEVPKKLLQKMLSGTDVVMELPDRVEDKGDVLVCPECWNLLEECSCRNLPNRAIQIDGGIYPAVRDLNRKGYKTNFCCEGHWREAYNCYCGAYLLFRKPIDKDLFPKLPTFPWKPDDKVESRIKTPIMTTGIGYKKWFKDMVEERAFYWTGTKYKRMSREEKDAEHQVFLRELKEWVDSLPSLR